MRRLIPFALVAFAVAAGCSPSGPATVRDFQTALDQIECQGKLKCCAGMPGAFTDEATCEASLLASSNITRYEADIAAGQARYDSGAAQRMLDLARPLIASCDNRVDARGLIADLLDVVVGTLPPGSACDPSHRQCAPGSQCENNVCTAQPALGAACTDQNCADVNSCIAGKCAVPLADGAACTDGNQCQSSHCDNNTCSRLTVAGSICTL
jgi:hypothetical protein